jgi:hypothetical protein
MWSSGIMVELNDLGDKAFDASGEARFRRGYVHGVQSLLNAVEPHLVPEQSARLRHWAAKELRSWQMARDEKIVSAPVPPDLGV